MKDKGLFFLILSFVCFWLVLDQVFGNKLIEQFVGNILPSTSKSNSSSLKQQSTDSYNVTNTENLKDGSYNEDENTVNGMTPDGYQTDTSWTGQTGSISGMASGVGSQIGGV